MEYLTEVLFVRASTLELSFLSLSMLYSGESNGTPGRGSLVDTTEAT